MFDMSSVLSLLCQPWLCSIFLVLVKWRHHTNGILRIRSRFDFFHASVISIKNLITAITFWSISWLKNAGHVDTWHGGCRTHQDLLISGPNLAWSSWNVHPETKNRLINFFFHKEQAKFLSFWKNFSRWRIMFLPIWKQETFFSGGPQCNFSIFFVDKEIDFATFMKVSTFLTN